MKLQRFFTFFKSSLSVLIKFNEKFHQSLTFPQKLDNIHWSNSTCLSSKDVEKWNVCNISPQAFTHDKILIQLTWKLNTENVIFPTEIKMIVAYNDLSDEDELGSKQ